MLIMRCAWHRRHFGYTSYTGLTRDFRWRVAFSDGICRPCKDVMLATARGAAPKSVSIKRELTRAAMALTGVAAWLLVMLLFAGCGREESPRSLGYYSNATTWCSYEDERHGRAMSMAEWQTSGCACARGVGPLDTNHYHRRVVAWACPR